MHAVVGRCTGLHTVPRLRECRVNCVEVVVRMAPGGGCCRRRWGVAGRGSGSRSVALGNGALAVAGLRRRYGRRRGVGGVERRRCVGGRLDLRRARLRLEDGVVTKTLAFALLAVAAHGVGFVALWVGFTSAQSRDAGGVRAWCACLVARLWWWASFLSPRVSRRAARSVRQSGVRAIGGHTHLYASLSARQTACLGATLDFLFVAAARQHARVALRWQLVAHRIKLGRAHAVVGNVERGRGVARVRIVLGHYVRWGQR